MTNIKYLIKLLFETIKNKLGQLVLYRYFKIKLDQVLVVEQLSRKADKKNSFFLRLSYTYRGMRDRTITKKERAYSY